MKKLLPLVILLLLVTWAGATWMIGSQVEQNFDRALNQLNSKLENDLPFVSVEPTRFDKGFFRSSASSKVTLRGAKDNEDALPLRHVIYHGPLMLTPLGLKTGSTYIVTTLDTEALPAETRKRLNDITNGQTPLTIGMLTGTGKDFDLDIEVAALALEDPEKGDTKIFIDGLSGSVKSDLDGSYLKGRITGGKVTLTADNGRNASIAPVIFDFDIDEMYKGTVLSGTSAVTTPRLEITSPELKTRIENLAFASNTQQAGNGTTAADMTLNLAPIAVEIPAKHFSLDSGSIDFTTRFEGIDTAQLKRLVDAGAQLHSLEMDAIKNGKVEPQQIEQNVSDYLENVVGLLKPGLKSATQLNAGSPDGKAALDLELSYADSRPATELATLRDLIAAVDGRLEVVSDQSLLQALSLDGLAAMPTAMGFATAEQGKIRSKIGLSKGVLSINGQPAPFLEMLGPILNEPSPLYRPSSQHGQAI